MDYSVSVTVHDAIQMGPLILKNRWVLAPMTTYSSHDDGRIADDELEYLRVRAGGFGLVMTAACCVHPHGKAFPGQWACDRDEMLESLASVAEVIRAEGSKSVLQIHHGGRACLSSLIGRPAMSASAVPFPRESAETPVAMTSEEIEEAIEAYGHACRRAEQAGFDAVEIHGANTYLIQQFVSPHSNQREDAYGQDRLLFSAHVVENCLAKVSPGYPVGYRFSPEEPWELGITLDQTDALVERLSNTNLTFLHVSLGSYDQGSIRGDGDEPVITRLNKKIAGRMPLIGVGGVDSEQRANACLGLGADLVAVGKASILNPDFPRKPSARKLFPKEEAAERLTLPQGLARRILSAPGWFPMED